MPETWALDKDEEFLAHLVNPDSWAVIQGEGVTEDLIEDDEIKVIFRWQKQHVRKHGRIATATVLADEFDLEFDQPETAIGDLLDRMRERYMRNQGRQALVEIVEEQRRGDPLEVPQMLVRRGRELTSLLARRGEVFGTGDFDRTMRRYDQKVEAGPGASFGFPQLDEYFYGMRGLNFLLGYKKSSKSWIMVKTLLENVEAGKCVWLYSLELPAEETNTRLQCLLAGVPWWRYIRNAITIEDRRAMREAAHLLDGLGVYRIVKPPHGQRGIHDLINTARDAGADLVLIDQLQYVENDKGKSLGRLNDPGEYWGVCDAARNLSDEGPIYVAHQFGRQAAFADEMPDISYAKGSSAIEEVCTVAIGLWSNKDMRRSGVTEIGTLISRNTSSFASWEMSVELNRGCSFEITRRIEDPE